MLVAPQISSDASMAPVGVSPGSDAQMSTHAIASFVPATQTRAPAPAIPQSGKTMSLTSLAAMGAGMQGQRPASQAPPALPVGASQAPAVPAHALPRAPTQAIPPGMPYVQAESQQEGAMLDLMEKNTVRVPIHIHINTSRATLHSGVDQDMSFKVVGLDGPYIIRKIEAECTSTGTAELGLVLDNLPDGESVSFAGNSRTKPTVSPPVHLLIPPIGETTTNTYVNSQNFNPVHAMKYGKITSVEQLKDEIKTLNGYFFIPVDSDVGNIMREPKNWHRHCEDKIVKHATSNDKFFVHSNDEAIKQICAAFQKHVLDDKNFQTAIKTDVLPFRIVALNPNVGFRTEDAEEMKRPFTCKINGYMTVFLIPNKK